MLPERPAPEFRLRAPAQCNARTIRRPAEAGRVRPGAVFQSCHRHEVRTGQFSLSNSGMVGTGHCNQLPQVSPPSVRHSVTHFRTLLQSGCHPEPGDSRTMDLTTPEAVDVADGSARASCGTPDPRARADKVRLGKGPHERTRGSLRDDIDRRIEEVTGIRARARRL